MDQYNHKQVGMVPHNSEDFGKVPKASETFGNVPNSSEQFRNVRNDSEGFHNVRNVSERMESHTLTVREAARLFEAAGVARTERSIVNWCQLNRTGIARLDSYFDPNERKYYLTLESVERAIQEEVQKSKKHAEPPVSEPFGTVRKDAEKEQDRPPKASETEIARVRELEKEVLDWRILNSGKDYFIQQLQKERDGFVNQLVSASRKVGELETRLLRLEPGKSDDPPSI